MSPCAECVVCGAPMGPGEPDHVALETLRERLTIDTGRRDLVNQLSASLDADTDLARRSMLAAKKTDRHTRACSHYVGRRR